MSADQQPTQDQDAEAVMWRVGRTVGRTLYEGDTLIGLMDTPALAERVVEAVNARKGSDGGAVVEGQWGQVARLRRWTCGTHTDHHDDECDVCHLEVDCREGADEIERLRSWKREAVVVLAEWEAVWETMGRPGALGESKAVAVCRALAPPGDTAAARICPVCGAETWDCRGHNSGEGDPG